MKVERYQSLVKDDYIKFIRIAEHLVEKNGNGVLGFITNHRYLRRVTHRGMRRHFSRTFDKIYVIDFHGSVKKELHRMETFDQNVFDIQQGVSISFFVKQEESEVNNGGQFTICALYGESAKSSIDDLWNDNPRSQSNFNIQQQAPYLFS